MIKKETIELISKPGDELNYHPYKKDYYNPILTRPIYMSLNGLFDFEINKSKLIPNEFKHKIKIHYPIESMLSLIHIEPKKGYYYHYHTTFTLDESYLKDRLFLVLARVSSSYILSINGIKVMEGDSDYDIRIDIRKYVNLGSNSLDICFKKSKNEYTGIIGEVNLYPVIDNYIKDVYYKSDIKNGTVTFSFDMEKYEGNLSLRYPNGDIDNYIINDKTLTINLKTINKYNLKDPYFYSFKIDSIDSVEGLLFLVEYNIKNDGFNYLTLNDVPTPIKGVIDDTYYSDGLTTFPGRLFIQDYLSKIKSLGFNSIYINRLELPLYYYYSCSKGVLIAQELIYTSNDNLLKDLNFLKLYPNVYLIIIKAKSKEDIELIYKISKEILGDRFIVVKTNKKSFGDINLFSNKLFSRLKKNKANVLYSLKYNKNVVENYKDFLNNDYYKLSMKGMIGYYFYNLKGNKNSIYTPNLYKKNIDL